MPARWPRLRDDDREDLPYIIPGHALESDRQPGLVARLGILALDLDDDLLKGMLGLTRARAGVVVAATAPGGGSTDDPLKAGDVIYALNQDSVTGVEVLRGLLAKITVGDPVVLQVEREGALRYIAFEMADPSTPER